MIYFLSFIFIIILSLIKATPLDDYVNTPDSHFSWKRLQKYPYSTYTLHVLNMTSQKWFDGIVALRNIILYTILILNFQLLFHHNQSGGITWLSRCRAYFDVHKLRFYLLVEVTIQIRMFYRLFE